MLFSLMEAGLVRKHISSGSYLEPEIGFSRAVRVGQFVAVSGTAPILATGGTAALGDVHAQTFRCLEIIDKAVTEAGATMANIIRTRIMLTNIGRWRDAARAHGEFFRDICRMGPEGLISKHRDRPYRGRQKFWIKVKNRSHPAMEREL